MNEKEKAKELVNKIYQPMGYLAGLNLNSNQMWSWASERAIDNVKDIINALKITTGHCELRHLDRHEVQNDFDYWDRVIQEIDKQR